MADLNVSKESGYSVLNASLDETSVGVSKENGYAVLNAALGDASVGTAKFGGYVVLNASPGEISVGATKLTGYVLVEREVSSVIEVSESILGEIILVEVDFWTGSEIVTLRLSEEMFSINV
jgi:hypothetical protein